MSEGPDGPAGATFQAVREWALALPGVEEGTSYGTPALRVRGRLFVRLWEDGETLVLRTDEYERDFLLESDPDAFFVTDHYRGYPIVLVRLAVVRPERSAPWWWTPGAATRRAAWSPDGSGARDDPPRRRVRPASGPRGGQPVAPPGPGRATWSAGSWWQW